MDTLFCKHGWLKVYLSNIFPTTLCFSSAGRKHYFCGNQNSLATISIVRCREKRPTAQLSLNTVFEWIRREHLRGFKITIGIIAANERHVVHLFFIEIILTHPHDLGVNLTDDLKRGEMIVTTKLLCFQFLMNGEGEAGYRNRRGVLLSVACTVCRSQ